MPFLLSSAKKVKTLNIRKDNGPERNPDGIITKAAQYQSREVPQARVEPNRKWFTNTRVCAFIALNTVHGLTLACLGYLPRQSDGLPGSNGRKSQ